MKKFRKTVSILLTLCLTAGLAAFAPLSASAQETSQPSPHTYELYDYFDAYKTAYTNGTEFENTSAWSMQTKKYNSDTWITDMSVCDTSIDPNWHYIRPDYEVPWVYTAGFAYQIYEQGGRYMNAIAIPANLSTNPDFNYNVAYTFTAPYDGIYSVSRADRQKVWSFYDVDGFHKMSLDEKLDFGVRITVDGTTVWPESDNEYYRDGWAEFGDLNAKTAYLNVPTIDDIRMNKDSVLRVEFTQFTPADTAWNQRILGMVAVSYVKTFPSEMEVPTADQVPIAYEVYDFYNALINQTVSNSPWEVAVSQDGTWHTLDRTYDGGDGYYFMHYNGISWGDNWPGSKVYRPSTYESGERYYYAFLTPSNGGTAPNTNAAYCFTTPFTGNYQFGKCSRDLCFSYNDMDYITSSDSLINSEYGARITVDGTTIWPKKDDSLYDNGWIHFGTKEGLVNRIEIPQIDMFLKENQVVRLEFADFAGMEWPWNNSISGIPSMTLKEIDGIALSNTSELEEAGLYLDEIEATVNTSYELYDGDLLHSKNVATKANDGIRLQVEATNLGDGVIFGLNGYTFLLNGAQSRLISPDGIVEEITVPVAANGLYNITYEVLPAFAANNLLGTFVSATVNGVSYKKLFFGEESVGCAKDGLTFKNSTGGNITVMPADLSLVESSEFVYNSATRVLYVGEATDFETVKNNILEGKRYSFVGNVITGNTFIRSGNDTPLMTYTIAVKGDVNADGAGDIKDLIRLKKSEAGLITLSDAQLMAGTFGQSDVTAAQALVGYRTYLLSK